MDTGKKASSKASSVYTVLHVSGARKKTKTTSTHEAKPKPSHTATAAALAAGWGTANVTRHDNAEGSRHLVVVSRSRSLIQIY